MAKVSNKILSRVYLLMAAMGLFSCLIIFRVVQIQFVEKDKWIDAVERERVYERVVPAARGNILSDDGKILATSQPFYRVPIDPSLIDTSKADFALQLDTLTKLLEANFGTVDKDQFFFHDKIMSAIRAKNPRRKHLFLLSQKVDFEDYEMLKTWPILRESKYRGGLIEDKINNTRFYPHDSLARITLGLMMHDTVPLKGLEYSFHKYLKGTEGVALVQRISGGDEIPLEVYQRDEDGADLETTLNIDMQEIVEFELGKAVRQHNAKFGVAVLMEVATGEIKAISNYPEVQNHAIATRIEPGSTFKLASFMAALEDRKINLEDTVDTGKGYIQFYDKTMKDHLALGKITYREAFEHSSNVVTARMINEIYGDRVEKWFAYLEKFGLTDKVMRQEHLVGEPSPIFIRPGETSNEWDGTTLPWMAIGYNSQITPLQILTFYNAVANNGKMMEPILVKKIRRGTRIIQEFESKVLNRKIASDNTLRQLRSLLEGVVERGTAKRIYMEEFPIAGKTGTAQKLNPETGKYTNVYQASFCGYFPADKPRYSMYVMIDEPSAGEYYGGSVAGTVFRDIALQVTAADMNMIPAFADGKNTFKPLTPLVHQGNAEAVYRKLDINSATEAEGTWARTQEKGGKITFTKVDLKPGKVPDVRGMSAKDAVALLESLGLKVMLTGHGKVRQQSIQAGLALEPRKLIVLELN